MTPGTFLSLADVRRALAVIHISPAEWQRADRVLAAVLRRSR